MTTTDLPAPGGYTEDWAPRGDHRIYFRDYPGEEPAVVLMHGFPDNLHLYDPSRFAWRGNACSSR
jgi:pimeloyl-ACP methyl ester carboxylesterase